MKILNTIHVGVGNRGKWPLEEATPERGFRPVAVVDLNPDFRSAAKEIVGPVPEFEDLGEALNQVNCDVVIICTPTVYHVPLGRQALAAGKGVLVEKGMAPDIESARELVAAVEQSGLACSVAQNYRYSAKERTLGRVLHDETDPHYVGTPYLIEYVQHRVRPNPGTLTYPYASLWDMSCHHFDNLHYWLGSGFEKISGTAYAAPWSPYEHPNNTSFHMRHRSGCQVVYTHTHDAAVNETRIRIMGERGAVCLDDDRIRFNPMRDRNFAPENWEDVPLSEDLGLAGLLGDFHRQVVEGVEPGIGARSNLSVMELCDCAQRACETETVQHLTGS